MTMPSQRGSAISGLREWAHGRELEVKMLIRGNLYFVGVYTKTGTTPLVERWSEENYEDAARYLANTLGYLGAGPKAFP